MPEVPFILGHPENNMKLLFFFLLMIGSANSMHEAVDAELYYLEAMLSQLERTLAQPFLTSPERESLEMFKSVITNYRTLNDSLDWEDNEEDPPSDNEDNP